MNIKLKLALLLIVGVGFNIKAMIDPNDPIIQDEELSSNVPANSSSNASSPVEPNQAQAPSGAEPAQAIPQAQEGANGAASSQAENPQFEFRRANLESGPGINHFYGDHNQIIMNCAPNTDLQGMLQDLLVANAQARNNNQPQSGPKVEEVKENKQEKPEEKQKTLSDAIVNIIGGIKNKFTEKPIMSSFVSIGSALGFTSLLYTSNPRFQKYLTKKFDDAQDAITEQGIHAYLKYHDIKENGLSKGDVFRALGLVGGTTGLILAQKRFDLIGKSNDLAKEIGALTIDNVSGLIKLVKDNPKETGVLVSAGLLSGIIYKIYQLHQIDEEYNSQNSIKGLIKTFSEDQWIQVTDQGLLLKVKQACGAGNVGIKCLDSDDFKSILTDKQLELFNKLIQNSK